MYKDIAHVASFLNTIEYTLFSANLIFRVSKCILRNSPTSAKTSGDIFSVI